MNNKISTEERIWAAAAHLSAIAMGMGLLLPVVGWSESRRKSSFAAFQSLQALGYQTLGYTLWILTTLVVLIVSGFVFAFGIGSVENLGAELYGFVFAHVAVTFGLIGLYFALPIIAAIACALGRDFRYPILGNRLASYLGYDSLQADGEHTWLTEEHEDRWVISMGHFAVIIMLWGMLVPATAWILQGKRSLLLKFQSVQTLVFQAGVLILSFASGVLYFGGIMFFLLTMGLSGEPDLNSSTGVIGIAVFLISMLIILFIVLLIPLLHIMGQWAGYRILKGDDYRYPILGKLIQRWVLKKTNVSIEEKSA